MTEHDRAEGHTSVRGVPSRCVAACGAVYAVVSLYRHFVQSLSPSLSTILLFQKFEINFEGFLLNFGRFRVQFAIRMLLLSVALQRFLNFDKVSSKMMDF